jgi:hypothetical protein
MKIAVDMQGLDLSGNVIDSFSSDRHIYWNNCDFRTLMAPILYYNYNNKYEITNLLQTSQQWNRIVLTDCVIVFDNANAPLLKQLPLIQF